MVILKWKEIYWWSHWFVLQWLLIIYYLFCLSKCKSLIYVHDWLYLSVKLISDRAPWNNFMIDYKVLSRHHCAFAASWDVFIINWRSGCVLITISSTNSVLFRIWRDLFGWFDKIFKSDQWDALDRSWPIRCFR